MYHCIAELLHRCISIKLVSNEESISSQVICHFDILYIQKYIAHIKKVSGGEGLRSGIEFLVVFDKNI